MLNRYALLTALCALTLTGCNAQDDISQMNPAEAWAHTHFNQKFSDDVPDEMRLMIKRDLIQTYERQLAVPDQGWFAKIFGGTRSTHVLKYLDDRISYVFPPADEEDANATNRSLDYWFKMIEIFPRPLTFEFNDERIRVRSIRVGIIQLGRSYFNRPPLARIGTLIHEARHSDCKGGTSASDARLVQRGSLPTNRACGYLHSICPSRYVAPNGGVMIHPYAGQPSCDDIAWGAYAINAVYQASVHESCTSCSQEEKQLALMISQDSFMRSNDITPRMLQGRLGDPEMSSSSHFERVQ